MDYFNVIKTAAENILLKKDNKFTTTATTYDITEYLNKTVPVDEKNNKITWEHKFVFVVMNFIEKQKLINKLDCIDCVTYKIYFINLYKPVYLTRKELIEKLKEHKDRFVSISWKKKDGTIETIKARPQPHFMNDLGYIDVYTFKKEFKQVNPKTIYRIKINGNIYLHTSLKV